MLPVYGISPVEFRRILNLVLNESDSVLVIAGDDTNQHIYLRRAIDIAIPTLSRKIYSLPTTGLCTFWDRCLMDSTFFGVPTPKQMSDMLRDAIGKKTVPRQLRIPFRELDVPNEGEFIASLAQDIDAVMNKRYRYAFFPPEPRVEWSTDTHQYMEHKVKTSIKVLLMVRLRRDTQGSTMHGTLADLPLEMMFEIFVQVQRLHWRREEPGKVQRPHWRYDEPVHTLAEHSVRKKIIRKIHRASIK